MGRTILIVDDDPAQRRLLQAAVERNGFATRTAENGAQAVNAVELHADIDIVMLDLVMPGMSGQEALREIKLRRADLPCIVLTASGGIDTVVQAMQAGANDFFVKPASPERILVSIRNALEMSNLKTEVVRMKKRAAGQLSFDDMVANAPVMAPVVRMGRRAAASNIPVLITGESGVGKEVLARAIQGASERAGRPFVTVNCGAIPENLVESILFGHVKGAFTGATDTHAGKFVEANGGTLFLDEVGELPLDAQVKLLRVLQESEVDPVGAKRPVKVDVRIISATNKDLAKLVADGRFREDLYYRLNVFPIEAPPLRERKEDLPTLVQRFIARFNAEEGRAVRGAAPATMQMLAEFDWPGNVRQLENAVFRAVILCEGDLLQPEDFPQISGLKPLFAANDTVAADMPAPANDTHVDVAHASFRQAMQAASDVSTAPVKVFDEEGHLRQLEQVERDLIELAIDHYAGHMSEVARRLGIGRSTLYRKLREYGLEERVAAEG
ncbi:MAG: sigma-54 dependent transcriptional regulator [Hyphomonadaceae bacterium]|nr:sigma-54 dependent transcriptional regulator [Hyphomonadaceae bacterium]MBY0565656.1 sigma-54 dependent transcriptional regulator [Hyphomonadaceae bacterium]